MSVYQRQTTWTNLGTGVDGCKSYTEVLAKAKLDYKVIKKKVSVEGADGFIPGVVATVKDTNFLDAFGFVSPDYEICQNEEAFDFISDINSQMEFVKAGSTSGRVWIIGKLPETEVLGDKVSPHLIFQNSHDGKHSIMTNLCILRIACQNQFNHSFKQGANVIKIRHSGLIGERLAEARKVLSSTYDYVGQYRDLAERFSQKHISDKVFQKVINEMFKVDMENAEISNKKQEKIDSFRMAWESEDNLNFKNTAWGVVNAYTDFATHFPLPRETVRSAERRFINTTVESSKMDTIIGILEDI